MTNMCTDNRHEIIAKAKEDLLKSTNIDTSPKEMEALDNFLFRCWRMGWLDRYNDKLTTDTVPVKHGEWVDDDNIQHKYFRCSECGIGRFNWGKDNFCPNCGADMRGEEE